MAARLKAENGLPQAEALQFANLSKSDWANALSRKIYTRAPPASPGNPRTFTVDDLIAAHTLGWMLEREVLPKFACQVAMDVLDQVKKSPRLESLSAWKCFKHDGSPYVVVHPTKPQKSAIELFKFNVGEIRARAIEGIKAKLTEQDGDA